MTTTTTDLDDLFGTGSGFNASSPPFPKSPTEELNELRRSIVGLEASDPRVISVVRELEDRSGLWACPVPNEAGVIGAVNLAPPMELKSKGVFNKTYERPHVSEWTVLDDNGVAAHLQSQEEAKAARLRQDHLASIEADQLRRQQEADRLAAQEKAAKAQFEVTKRQKRETALKRTKKTIDSETMSLWHDVSEDAIGREPSAALQQRMDEFTRKTGLDVRHNLDLDGKITGSQITERASGKWFSGAGEVEEHLAEHFPTEKVRLARNAQKLADAKKAQDELKAAKDQALKRAKQRADGLGIEAEAMEQWHNVGNGAVIGEELTPVLQAQQKAFLQTTGIHIEYDTNYANRIYGFEAVDMKTGQVLEAHEVEDRLAKLFPSKAAIAEARQAARFSAIEHGSANLHIEPKAMGTWHDLEARVKGQPLSKASLNRGERKLLKQLGIDLRYRTNNGIVTGLVPGVAVEGVFQELSHDQVFTRMAEHFPTAEGVILLREAKAAARQLEREAQGLSHSRFGFGKVASTVAAIGVLGSFMAYIASRDGPEKKQAESLAR